MPAGFNRDYPPLPLMEDAAIAETNPDQRHLTRRYTERAIQFMRQHAEEPFFLYLPQTMPHVPLFVSGPFTGKARYGLYGDVVQELDWSVGAILATLGELKLNERTLVIFTSDNGPWLSKGSQAGRADPLRDGKITRFEGGHRVPCVMRWTGSLPAGRVLDGIVGSIDLLPTLAGLAGTAPPQDRKIDGMDQWAYLSGKEQSSPRDTFFYSPQVVRRGQWEADAAGQIPRVFSRARHGGGGPFRRIRGAAALRSGGGHRRAAQPAGQKGACRADRGTHEAVPRLSGGPESAFPPGGTGPVSGTGG